MPASNIVASNSNHLPSTHHHHPAQVSLVFSELSTAAPYPGQSAAIVKLGDDNVNVLNHGVRNVDQAAMQLSVVLAHLPIVVFLNVAGLHAVVLFLIYDIVPTILDIGCTSLIAVLGIDIPL
ncbi:hypothetical protein BD779DRAFT_1674420 [Infundibulicybe gibba]|nr:hypothetical protein BD779DRAFT_1674420 [Infundibulicybe gibba]